MRLISAATDLACTGAATCIGALPILVLALEDGSAETALYYFAIMTAGLSASGYLFTQRRRLRAAVTRLAPAPALEREAQGSMLARAATAAVVQGALLIALGLAFRAVGVAGVDAFALYAGIAMGLGLTNLLAARWLRTWEQAHREDLVAEVARLRAPWRWRPKVQWTSRPLVLYSATTGAGSA
jgi:hypothetical protein